jgi:hypothetical protein
MASIKTPDKVQRFSISFSHLFSFQNIDMYRDEPILVVEEL